MYIIKNALTSIWRNKGRNLLIGIIILVISCASAVTLAINNSSSDLIDAYASKYETQATIGINRDNMMKDFDPTEKDNSKENMQQMFEGATVDVSDVKKYADSDYVKSYYYTLSASVNGNNLEAATMDDKSPQGDMPQMQSSADFTLKGYSSLESMEEFVEGKYTITDGKVSENFESNDCIISSELATLNSINVGDTITLVDPDNSDNTIELTVTGIYSEEKNTSMKMFSDSANTIITNVNAVNKLSEGNSDLKLNTSPTFILTNSNVVEDFETELYEKGLNENLSVQTNLDEVNSATSTISNVKTFAVTFLVITLVIGTVVLLVINMINIRERKYEIGVLRTIGMKKSKVAMQFIIELLVVATVSLLLGAGIGSVISVPVSNSLLQNEISSSQNDNKQIEGNFGMDGKNDMNFKGVPTIQAYDSIDAVVDIKVLLELLGIGFCITIISSASAMISIQRFSPLTILKERS